METKFTKNQLKPGDPGFEYDKRTTFEKQVPLEDDSWEESDEEAKPAKQSDEEEDDMDYFDDDFN